MFFNIGLSNIFLDMSPQARATKAKVNKWDFIELNCFFPATETMNKMKRQFTDWEKISASHIFENG